MNEQVKIASVMATAVKVMATAVKAEVKVEATTAAGSGCAGGKGGVTTAGASGPASALSSSSRTAQRRPSATQINEAWKALRVSGGTDDPEFITLSDDEDRVRMLCAPPCLHCTRSHQLLAILPVALANACVCVCNNVASIAVVEFIRRFVVSYSRAGCDAMPTDRSRQKKNHDHWGKGGTRN